MRFEQIRQRIRSAKGRIRKMGSDYLAYTLMDSIVDEYYKILEIFGERIETLEDSLLGNSDHDILHEIHSRMLPLSFFHLTIFHLPPSDAMLLNFCSSVV